MGFYSFTPSAKIKLRDFNELPHVFTKRINKCHDTLTIYLAQFRNEPLNIILKFMSFTMGSTLLVLIIVSFFNSDIIVIHIFLNLFFSRYLCF